MESKPSNDNVIRFGAMPYEGEAEQDSALHGEAPETGSMIIIDRMGDTGEATAVDNSNGNIADSLMPEDELKEMSVGSIEELAELGGGFQFLFIYPESADKQPLVATCMFGEGVTPDIIKSALMEAVNHMVGKITKDMGESK